MTDFPPLPPHPIRRSFIRSAGPLSNNGWTGAEVDAIQAIQREAALWALEEAAKVCDACLSTYIEGYGPPDAGAAIRALKEKIE